MKPTLYPLPSKYESLLPTAGHSTHWIDDALVSFFGKPNQPPVTIVGYLPSSISISTPSPRSPSPSRRFAHTTTLLHTNATSKSVFLIGGSTIDTDLPQSDLWHLDWLSQTWTKLALQGDPFTDGLMGHVTLPIARPYSVDLLTCFGANHKGFSQHCTLFNTNSLAWRHLHPPSLPIGRIHSTLIPVNNTHGLLYGGLSDTSTLLGDLWWVGPDSSSSSMITFTFLCHSIPRAGHDTTMISETLMLVQGGDDDNTTAMMDLETLPSLYDSNHRYHKRRLTLRSPADDVGQAQQDGVTNGISGGAIGGIVVAVLLIVGLSVALLVFYQRRRQRNYDLHSRAARFSLSTPPRPSESYIERRSMVIQQPEAAKTRLSHMSFGSDFGGGGLSGTRLSSASLPQPPSRSKLAASTSSLPSAPPVITTTSTTSTTNNHPNLLDSPSRQLYTNWICETPVPPTMDNSNNITIDPRHTSMYVNQSMSPDQHDEDHEYGDDGKKRSSTAFKRLRLSLFKPLELSTPTSITEHPDPTTISLASSVHQPDPSMMEFTTATKRRSSMFGLSKFLNRYDDTDDTTGPPQQVYRHLDPRESLGSKSVASLQWVEFNNDMDISGNLTPRQLAVMNHRQSCTTISSGSGLSGYLGEEPTSPRNVVTMAQQLQQHHRQQYRLSHPRDDPRRMITSPPHRLAIRDPSKTSSFPTLAPIHID